jgi:hypothetical protein
VGSFFSCYHNYNNRKFGFFYLATISIIGGGIYLCFDHKHFHNKFIFLLPSFHSLVATSTFTIIKKILLLSFHNP